MYQEESKVMKENHFKEIINQLELPNGMSIIARTAGIGRSLDELKWDLNYLLQLWDAIKDASESQKSPFLIFQDGSLVIRLYVIIFIKI